jgi:glycosyltransferase involved in cell wall biosynthesis
MEIIQEYSPYLRYWSSYKDSGQSDAINQGLRMATGEIVGWLNSDDWYEPGIFKAVANYFVKNPDKNIVMGDCHRINQSDLVFDNVFNIERGFKEIIKYWKVRSIPTQPTLFFRRKLLDIHGYLDPSLHYAMDYDLWLRFSHQNRFYHIEQFFANYRFHPGSKGGEQEWNRFIPEWKKVFRRYAGFNPGLWIIYFWIDLRSFVKRIRYKIFSNDIQKH